MWRVFLALPMPSDVQQLVSDLTRTLESEAWPVRWSHADSAHLTLHFLGEIFPEQAELLRLSLRAVVERCQPFELRTGALGVFPDIGQPRVIWLGLLGQTARLVSLHNDLGRALERLELPVEDRAFRPHITLGRVRDDPPKDLGGRVERRLSDPALSAPELGVVEFPVREVVLFRSILERGGFRYERLATYPLIENAETSGPGVRPRTRRST